MTRYAIEIVSNFEVDIEDLDAVRAAISEGFTLPEFPDFILEDAIEYIDGTITYTEI